MRVFGRLLASVVLASAPLAASAADVGQGTVRDLYATYIRQGANAKNVSAYKPYMTPALYALFKRWLTVKPATSSPYACDFDSDPIINTQNGAGVSPVSVGAPTVVAGKSYLPVSITMRFAHGPGTKDTVVKDDSKTLASVVETNGHYALDDIVPVVDGKSYPKESLHAELARFAANPACRAR